MNEEQRSEEYYAELAEHRTQGDANEANAEGMIYPQGEPIEATGKYAEARQNEEEKP